MARLWLASRFAVRPAHPPESAAPPGEHSGSGSGALPAARARSRARRSARAGASEASSRDVAVNLRRRARVQAAQRAAAARTATPSRHGRSVCFVLCCLRLVSGTRWSVQQSPHGSGVVLRCTFVWVHRHGHGVQPRAVTHCEHERSDLLRSCGLVSCSRETANQQFTPIVLTVGGVKEKVEGVTAMRLRERESVNCSR